MCASRWSSICRDPACSRTPRPHRTSPAPPLSLAVRMAAAANRQGTGTVPVPCPPARRAGTPPVKEKLMHTADSSRALLILVLICTAYLLIPFHRMTPSIMSAAIMSETGMGPVMIGFLSSILFLTFADGVRPSGRQLRPAQDPALLPAGGRGGHRPVRPFHLRPRPAAGPGRHRLRDVRHLHRRPQALQCLVPAHDLCAPERPAAGHGGAGTGHRLRRHGLPV